MSYNIGPVCLVSRQLKLIGGTVRIDFRQTKAYGPVCIVLGQTKAYGPVCFVLAQTEAYV